MKKYLLNLIAKKEARKVELENKRTELLDENDNVEDLARAKEINRELRSIGETLKALEQEIKEAREALEKEEDNQDDEGQGEQGEGTSTEEKSAGATSEEVQRSKDWVKVEHKNVKKVFSTEERGGSNMKNLEQRQAFMDAIYSGDFAKVEKRDITNTGDLSYVIPENLINDIITEVENRGYILSKVNRTSFAVGQTIPVGLLDVKATWVGAKEGNQIERSGEGLGSAVQKGGVEATIVFFNYKLRCEIALTHESQIQALEIFERKFVQQVSDAMVEELETAVVSGDGVNQPKGILTETPRDGKALEIASGTKLTYADLIRFAGAVPRKYRNGAVAFMSQNTFNSLMSIVDENGQPVAKVNSGVDGDLTYRLFGMPVELADEYLEDYALTVDSDKIFAFIYNFKEYTLNTNYNLGVQSKVDWDTDNKHYKAVLAADGKAVTKYSFVTFTVKAGASA